MTPENGPERDPSAQAQAQAQVQAEAEAGGQRMGLASRLFLAHGLVIVAGAGTLLIVALLFAPPVLRAHLAQAGLPAVSTQVRDHVEEAFDRALLICLLVGVGTATLTAGAISWLAAQRLAAPVQDVARAAQRLADGHYDTPVPDPRLGPEFHSLARSMNQLSSRLAGTEADRRRLTADLAHQLRTPIASVRATVEALSDGVLAADPPTLGVLADQADRLHRLVADLEKVSRAQERQLLLRPTPQPLGALAERCVAALRGRYRAAGVELVLDVDAAAPPVRIDADRLTEALTNLLDNALRHTPAAGRVRVSVCPGRPGRPAHARLTVTDTGSGFEPEAARLLFERFHRGPAAAPGTGSGLGLTIARAIIEAHAGTLVGDSRGPGRGATFTITLPAAR
jgi:two-component system, OmpR family, sensor histidine kinase BaeS